MIWQTRTLATFISATVETEGENTLLAQAQMIGVKPDEEETKAANDPGVGSYERFFSTFGNPRRWAGNQ